MMGEMGDESGVSLELPQEAALADLWAKLLEAVGRVSPFTRSYLLEGHPVSFTNHVFVIGFDPEFEDHLSLVDNARNHALLQTKLLELGHPNFQIKFVKAESPARRVPADPAALPVQSVPSQTKSSGPVRSAAPPLVKERLGSIPFDKDSFKNDPLIQKALEIFKGQIVEVRA